MLRRSASDATLDLVLACCFGLLAVFGIFVMAAASLFAGFIVGSAGVWIARALGAAW